jgi:hypothetical protein
MSAPIKAATWTHEQRWRPTDTLRHRPRQALAAAAASERESLAGDSPDQRRQGAPSTISLHRRSYNYFATQQELFDQLLPAMGRKMLEFIKNAASAAANGLEREELSFRAFVDFLKRQPEFYRILYEAELCAPTAFKTQQDNVTKGYVRVLERALAEGDLISCEKRDLKAIAQILMGARHYLAMRYARSKDGIIGIPEWVVRAYMNMVRRALYERDAKNGSLRRARNG